MADNASSLRNGNKVLIENQPYLILDTDFVNPGKGQAFTRIKIRNLLNNKVLEKTIKIGEALQEADVLNTKMQFLYKENNTYFFMNLETYAVSHSRTQRSEKTYIHKKIHKMIHNFRYS